MTFMTSSNYVKMLTREGKEIAMAVLKARLRSVANWYAATWITCASLTFWRPTYLPIKVETA